MIEKHVTLGDAEGTSVPDDKMALRITHLAAYVSHAIEAARMRGSERVRHEWDVHEMRRGIYAAIDIAEGHELGADHLVCLRPAGDVIASAGNWHDIVGRPARTALRAGEPIPAEWLHRGR